MESFSSSVPRKTCTVSGKPTQRPRELWRRWPNTRKIIHSHQNNKSYSSSRNSNGPEWWNIIKHRHPMFQGPLKFYFHPVEHQTWWNINLAQDWLLMNTNYPKDHKKSPESSIPLVSLVSWFKRHLLARDLPPIFPSDSSGLDHTFKVLCWNSLLHQGFLEDLHWHAAWEVKCFESCGVVDVWKGWIPGNGYLMEHVFDLVGGW